MGPILQIKKINFINISLSFLVILSCPSLFPNHTHATQKHTFFRVDFPSAFSPLSFGVLTQGTHILSSMKLKLCSSSDIRACGKAFQTFGDAFSLICLMLTKLNHNWNHAHFLMARHLIEKLKKENALRCSFLIFFFPQGGGWVFEKTKKQETKNLFLFCFVFVGETHSFLTTWQLHPYRLSLFTFLFCFILSF